MKSIQSIFNTTRSLVIGSAASQSASNQPDINFNDAIMVGEDILTSSMLTLSADDLGDSMVMVYEHEADESFDQKIQCVDNILGLSAFDCEAAEEEIAEDDREAALNSVLNACDNEDSTEVSTTDLEAITATFLEPTMFICQMPTIDEDDESEDDNALSLGATN